jgi:uncharacterized protein (DUF58 family)
VIPKEILQKVRQIEIRTRSIVDSVLSGEYQSVFKGRGMEFSEVRTYIPGDDIRSIDWNVTARMGGPYVKKYTEERELTVMLVVDASSSGSFGSVKQFKDEIAVELCALLAFSAIKNNDRVGLIIFTSEVEKYIPPKKGKNHVLRVIRELLYFKPAKKGTNIAEAMGFLNRVQRRKAVVFCVSDFIASGFEAPLRVAAQRHDFIAVTITDPREMSLTNVGLIELEDPETGQTMLVNTRSKTVRERFHQEAVRRMEALRSFFKVHGIDEIPVTTEADYIGSLVKFFKKREKMYR